MPPRMPRHSLRHVVQTNPPIRGPAAKIDVLEPDGMEPLVKPTELAPHRGPDHEKSPGRLLHHLPLAVIEVQTAIPPIHFVTGPYPVEQESFQNQRGRSGELTHHETDLRMSAGVHRPP